MKSERDLVCPNTKNCCIYESYFPLAKIEDNKIIKFDKTNGFFCYALETYSKLHRDSKNKGNGKDCALIQLLNNTDALIHLSDKTSL